MTLSATNKSTTGRAPSEPVGYSYDHIMKTDALPSTPIHVIRCSYFFCSSKTCVRIDEYLPQLRTRIIVYFVRISLIRVSRDRRIINNVKYIDSMARNQICIIYLNVRLFHNKYRFQINSINLILINC